MMSLAIWVTCAALILGRPDPGVDFVTVRIEDPNPAECARAKRFNGCSGLEYDQGDGTMLVIIHPYIARATTVRSQQLLVHAACHVVLFGNGMIWKGEDVERQCEEVQVQTCPNRVSSWDSFIEEGSKTTKA